MYRLQVLFRAFEVTFHMATSITKLKRAMKKEITANKLNMIRKVSSEGAAARRSWRDDLLVISQLRNISLSSLSLMGVMVDILLLAVGVVFDLRLVLL